MGLGYSLTDKPSPTMLADRLEDALIAIAGVRDNTPLAQAEQRLCDVHDELADIRDLQRFEGAVE